MTCQTQTQFQSIALAVGIAVAGGGAALIPAQAFADPLSVGNGAVFRLNPGSAYEQGCYAPCLCPIMIRSGVRGTLKLIYTGSGPALDTYAVEDVNWTVPAENDPLTELRIVGSGTYQIGSPDVITLVQHRLQLDLRIGDEPVQHFDSGWVPVEDPSKILIAVSLNGMYCWDTVIRVDASRVPNSEIQPYLLTSDSTFQRGCFDPCDCPLEAERPLMGTFGLVPLIASLPVTEYAVVDVHWNVPFNTVGESIPITGFGVYQLLGDFTLQHRLALDLIVGNEAQAHFDSGVVLGGGAFPRIDAVVSEHGIVCLDTVLHVVADPLNARVCGTAGQTCEPGEFCKRPVGQCSNDAAGICTQIPTDCPAVWDPVCGCDGVTYGNECEADAAAVSIAHWGACEAVCEPVANGFGCTPLACSAIPEEQCIPTVLQIDYSTGAITTLACDCQDFNLCHIDFGNASPFAEGFCPDGGVCEVVGSDTDGDGVDDQFRAECVGTGACCSDMSGAPLPLPVCTEVSQNACEAGGLFEGIGTTCGPDDACCFPVGSGSLCHDLDPFCCAAFGGVSQGAGSACPDVACGPVCGGIAGIPCEDAAAFCKLPEGTCNASDMLGICTPIPGVCPGQWDPVCGCDGVTYGNACEANAAGVSVDHRGPCARMCGGLGPVAPCDAGIFCKYPDGVCGDGIFQGVCTPIPDACPDIWAPVCGCDGVTYGNECESDAAGSSIAGHDACPWICCNPDTAPPCIEGPFCCADGSWACGDASGGSTCNAPGIVCGPVCGGIAGIPCYDAGAFCKFPEGTCGMADIFGMCTPVPSTGCPEIYDPVCGCDGVTYDNACVADAARVSIAHRGPCEHRCSEVLGLPPCANGLFCLYPEGTCDDGMNPGICTTIPGACPQVLAPVCGCDHVTYGNECEANAAGVSILHLGECERPCDASGTTPPCASDEFCKLPPGTCDDPTVPGVCTTMPQACPDNYDPVCGCDGVTYGNECEADAAGVSVDHVGECAGTPCAATRFFSNVTGSYCPQVPQTVRIALTPPAATTVVAVEDVPPAGWLVGAISNNGTYDAANGKVKWGPFFAPDIPAAVTYEVTPGNDTTGVACFDGTISVNGVNEQVCGDACIDPSCPPFMQADLPQPPCAFCPIGDCTSCPEGSCRDGRITMCELIGYACAWKVGCNDDLAGMTRAAFIWRHGECYCWDETQSIWSPVSCPPPDSGLCADVGTGGNPAGVAGGGSAVLRAERPASRKSRMGINRTVYIDIEAPAGASAMALEVGIPKGWKVTGISDDGDWDGVRRKIKWGPFFEGLSRTVSFTAPAPEATPSPSLDRLTRIARPGRLSGTVSFDGVNQPLMVK